MQPRTKSSAISAAAARADKLKSISTTLDLGHGLTLEAYEKLIADARATFDAANEALATAANMRGSLRDIERRLRDLSERMLTGVAATFGRDSVEYNAAGGKRKSERKRPTHKEEPTT